MPGDPDDGKYEEVAVLGRDDLWHHVSPYGTTVCGMGRKSPLHYDAVPVGCLFCIDKAADGYRTTHRSVADLT